MGRWIEGGVNVTQVGELCKSRRVEPRSWVDEVLTERKERWSGAE